MISGIIQSPTSIMGQSIADLTRRVDNTLPLSGATMSGNINMGLNKITNHGTPTAPNDVVNKSYVDAVPIGNLVISTTSINNNGGPATGSSVYLSGWASNATNYNITLISNKPTIQLQPLTGTPNGSYIQYAFGNSTAGLYKIVYSVLNTDMGALLNLTETRTGLTIRSGYDSYTTMGSFSTTIIDYFYLPSDGTFTIRWTANGNTSSTSNYQVSICNAIQLIRLH